MRKYITLFFIYLGILASANAQNGPVWGQVTPEIDCGVTALQYIPGEGVYAGGCFSTPQNKIILIKGTEVQYGGGGFPESDGTIWEILHSGLNIYTLSDIPGMYFSMRNTNTHEWEPVPVEVDGPLYGGIELPDGRIIVLGAQTLPYPQAFIWDGENATGIPDLEIPSPYGLNAAIYNNDVYITYNNDDINIVAWNIESESSITFVNPPSNQGINGIYADEEYLYIGMLSNTTDQWEMWRYNGENWEYIYTFAFPFTNNGFTRDGDDLYAFGDGQVWIYNVPTGEMSIMTTTFEGQPVYDIEKDESTGILYFSMGQVAWYGIDTTDVSIIGTQPQNINVYPNPATDFVTIEIDLDYGNLTIHNSLGQNIEPIMLSGSSDKIILDVRNLPKGIYSVQTENSEGRFVARFIK